MSLQLFPRRLRSRHVHGSCRILRTCASLDLLPCWPLPNQQFILWQRGFGGWGGSWSITKTMAPYGEQKDLPLAFSNCAAYYVRQWRWRRRSLEGDIFFCITTDNKGKVIWFPFRGIIAETTRRGEIYGLGTMALLGQHTGSGSGRHNGLAWCSSNQHHVKRRLLPWFVDPGCTLGNVAWKNKNNKKTS